MQSARLLMFVSVAALLSVVGLRPARAQSPADASRSVARLLERVTVTVRIQHPRKDAPPPAAKPRATAPPAEAPGAKPGLPEVTVCSGVSLGEGLVVTHDNVRESHRAAPDRYRVTLPDGKQAVAKLAVVDQYSQLHLLEVQGASLAALHCAKSTPAVGSRIMSAAGSGIDRPVVSLGIVGAVDRWLPGVYLPPLIQCDIRTTETSTGAAIVDLTGQMVGVVAYTDPPEQRDGWTYAVPAVQVQRLLRARVSGETVVLRRRRPTVGLTLGPGEKKGTVVVEQVEKDGPAHLAGVLPGDYVREANGRTIRSAYQAVRQILNRQPGDTFTVLLERNQSTKAVDITLGGGAVVPVESEAVPSDIPLVVQQNVRVGRAGAGFSVQHRGTQVRNLSVAPAEASIRRMSLDRLEDLERQIALYREENERLLKQIRQRDLTQAELEKIMSRMLGEIRELHQLRQAPEGQRQAEK